MLDFMDYIQLAFAEATNWNRDNSYSCLTTTTQCKSAIQGCAVDLQLMHQTHSDSGLLDS